MMIDEISHTPQNPYVFKSNRETFAFLVEFQGPSRHGTKNIKTSPGFW